MLSFIFFFVLIQKHLNYQTNILTKKENLFTKNYISIIELNLFSTLIFLTSKENNNL